VIEKIHRHCSHGSRRIRSVSFWSGDFFGCRFHERVAGMRAATSRIVFAVVAAGRIVHVPLVILALERAACEPHQYALRRSPIDGPSRRRRLPQPRPHEHGLPCVDVMTPSQEASGSPKLVSLLWNKNQSRRIRAFIRRRSFRRRERDGTFIVTSPAKPAPRVESRG
jgi:hypothetical protein